VTSINLIWKIYYYELVTGMDFGSEMLSVAGLGDFIIVRL